MRMMVTMMVRKGREKEKGVSCEWTRSCLGRCLVLVRDGQGIFLVWMLLCFDDALSFCWTFFSFDGQIRCLLVCVTGIKAEMAR